MRIRNIIAMAGFMLAGMSSQTPAHAQEIARNTMGSPLESRMQRPTIRYAIPASELIRVLAESGLVVAPEQIVLAIPISSTVPAPALQLTSAELRQDGSLLLRFACRNAPECMPFFAAVTTPDRAEALAALAKLHGPVASAMPQHLPGVTVGAHLLLELSDQQMHIHMPVVAIDAGAPGSEIRVATLDRRHTYRGVVADPTMVKAVLQ